jgi:hypothetical protein
MTSYRRSEKEFYDLLQEVKRNEKASNDRDPPRKELKKRKSVKV